MGRPAGAEGRGDPCLIESTPPVPGPLPQSRVLHKVPLPNAHPSCRHLLGQHNNLVRRRPPRISLFPLLEPSTDLGPNKPPDSEPDEGSFFPLQSGEVLQGLLTPRLTPSAEGSFAAIDFPTPFFFPSTPPYAVGPTLL